MCLVSNLNKYLCSYDLQIEQNGLNLWDVGGTRHLQTPQRREQTDWLCGRGGGNKAEGLVQSWLGRGSGWQEDTGGHLVTPTWVTALLTDCDSGLSSEPRPRPHIGVTLQSGFWSTYKQNFRSLKWSFWKMASRVKSFRKTVCMCVQETGFLLYDADFIS